MNKVEELLTFIEGESIDSTFISESRETENRRLDYQISLDCCYFEYLSETILEVEAFIECGVRPALIPMLISYLQDRKMVVKWHGETSSVRNLNGGGPQGATFGIWEYLAQSNSSADLTVLEKINLLIVGQVIMPSHLSLMILLATIKSSELISSNHRIVLMQ